ncbi:MAG: metal ABC transporter substrate-binding protein, partial [candidate division KSB1 bacterium]|nr:metal ABC transporter substrate-binding protein [candidate division KSB1 bacterium]
MRKRSFAQGLIFLFWLAATSPLWGQGRLFVVGSLPDFAAIAQEIGGEKVEVASIARGNENPHFVLPKPSFARLLQKADLFITTGLDLELWAPTLIDASRNRR